MTATAARWRRNLTLALSTPMTPSRVGRAPHKHEDATKVPLPTCRPLNHPVIVCWFIVAPVSRRGRAAMQPDPYGTTSSRVLSISLALLVLPAFYDPVVGDITATRAFTGSTTDTANGAVHIGIVVSLLALPALVSRLAAGSPCLFGQHLFLWLGVIYASSVIVGVTSGAGLLGLAFFAQTVLPLVIWYVFATGRLAPLDAVRAVLTAVPLTLLFVVAVVVVRAGDAWGSYTAVQALVASVPQYRSYFAIIPTCGLAFAIVGWRHFPRRSLVTVLLVAATLPLMWSRAGLAMVVVAAIVALMSRPGRTPLATRAAWAIAATSLAAYVVSRSLTSGVVAARDVAGSTAEASGRSRLALMREAWQRLFDDPVSPLVGDAFVPYSRFLAGGTEVDVARLFPAHNQYLDVALRGGLPALVLTVAVLVVFGRRAHRLRQDADPGVATFHAALLAVIVAVALGNLTHLYLVQPWSGALIFALLGVSSSIRARTPTSGGRTMRPPSAARPRGGARSTPR